MGRQISYYIRYSDFLTLAECALESGCTLYRRSFEDGHIVIYGGNSLDTVKADCPDYYFHLPDVGSFAAEIYNGSMHISPSSLASVIEAGFSIPDGEKRFIPSKRLYMTNTEDNRPERLFNKLVRLVKKSAPFTQVEHYVQNPMYSGEKFRSKKYISPALLPLVTEEDYIL